MRSAEPLKKSVGFQLIKVTVIQLSIFDQRHYLSFIAGESCRVTWNSFCILSMYLRFVDSS